MGTLVRIKLYAADEEQAKAAFQGAFARIAQLDRILSDYRADSELNVLCRSAAGRPVRISRDLYRVLAAAQRLAQESDGAFDVTQGPVIRLWRQARHDGRLPDPADLRAASARGGFRKLHLNRSGPTATLDQAGMQLDVGGIGKGYAADAALEVLGRMGIASALVAASGDLALSHAPPGERGWKIGIDSRDGPDASFSRVLELSDAAVSTSGDSEQAFEAGGTRYSHIIDPATGEALTNGLTVSVIARRGVMADGLATAVCVLGTERGLALIKKRPGAAAILVPRSKDEPIESARFRGYLR
ncbi:MAG TPA: FAD:protein FMN transferase [Bryobacteraceae bacterium]|nr:FAD:protein FMN transferase [Bryobacteraceae bacterium]